MHVAHFLLRSAQRCPNRPLWLGVNGTITYQEGASRLNRIARGLLARGEPKDRVAILSTNRFEAYEIFLATMNAGMIAVPMNPRLHTDEHAYMIADSGARFVVCSEDYVTHLGRVRGRLGSVEHWFCIGKLEDGAAPYEQLLEGQNDARSDISIDPSAVAWLFYTSGTTGKPKGAMKTHRSVITMVQQCLIGVVPDLSPTDVVLHAAPIAHGTANLGLAHLAVGAANAFPLTRSFDPPRIFEAIERFGVTSTFLAPTMIQMLVRSPDRTRYNLSSLKNVVYGGGPMHAGLLREALAAFGPVFVQVYGQGEATFTCTALPKDEHMTGNDPIKTRRLRSAGREMPGVVVRIVDDEDRPLPPGGTGEIVVRSDLVMAGYWNDPEASAEALRNGWLHTGDVGHLDEDGYLYITDRKKDMIISGGSNIYPREVEEILLTHPAVAEVAVIGVPDEKWGESVKAIVVLIEDGMVTEAELIEFCRDRIASYKKPKFIEFAGALPKSAYGKILKRELRKKYWKDSDRNI